MAELQQQHDVHIRWYAFELRPPEAGPIDPAYRAQIEAGRPRLLAIAREHYGLELKPGPFGINSRPALIGSKYAAAQAEAAGKAYHQAVLEAYWLQGLDISDPELLADLAAAAGLDRPAFTAALAEPQWRAAVARDVQQAFQYGLNGVPASIFGNKYLVSGAQPYEVLVQVVTKLQEEADG